MLLRMCQAAGVFRPPTTARVNCQCFVGKFDTCFTQSNALYQIPNTKSKFLQVNFSKFSHFLKLRTTRAVKKCENQICMVIFEISASKDIISAHATEKCEQNVSKGPAYPSVVRVGKGGISAARAKFACGTFLRQLLIGRTDRWTL